VRFSNFSPARQKQIIGASVRFAKHTLPEAVRPARILWHQIIGFLFLALTLSGASFLVRAFKHFTGDGRSWAEVLLSSVFTVILGGYAVSSFLRARRLARR
jgi:hypothetical protein